MPIEVPKSVPSEDSDAEPSEAAIDEASKQTKPKVAEKKNDDSSSEETNGIKAPGNNGEPANNGNASDLKTKQVGGGTAPAPDTKDEEDETLSESGQVVDSSGVGKEPSQSAESTSTSIPTADVEGLETQETRSDTSVFRRMFYLKHFFPDDIVVHIQDHTLLIDAKHGRHVDEHGFVSRSFVRKHKLPEYVIAEKLTSYFTGDGVLVVQAPCSQVSPESISTRESVVEG